MQVLRRYSWLWIALLLVTVASIIMLSLANTRSPLTKATWIWDAKQMETQTDEMIEFAEKNEINLIYLHVEPAAVAPQMYRTFIEKANQAGIKVEALGGDPNWALTANRQSIDDLISWVKAFNRSAKPDERFSGIHVDIEPYLLPAWKEDQTEIVRQWLKNVSYLAAETKKDTDLAVGADLPFWIDSVNVPGSDEKVSNWMVQRLDSITLMAYRNQALGQNGIVEIVEKIVDDANVRKKGSVIVGVNIMETMEGAHVSFYEEGTEEMNNQLAILQEELSNNPAFAGSAIHDYESWKHASQREEQL
ncbi:hypothetical protein BP422_01955 [Brevibacillus formosus]|uniref:Amidase n=1 Tax=Brevibacillus formosus TaxID=54913 RepID=A0A220MCN4_9BACL|nr:hypothetical protein [Brevibacillus formosus]ASJ52410.1 hypothetical protein BP422_01955 [Brevibacillus formosus]